MSDTPPKPEITPAQQELFEILLTPAELHPDLALYVHESRMGWQVLQHPLVYSVPYHTGMNNLHNKQYEQKTKAVEQALQEKAWSTYVYLHERPWRIIVFAKIKDQLTDQEYWEMLAGLWTDTENPYQNIKHWKALWTSPRPGRSDHAMDNEEREALAALPDVLPIYRGFQHKRSVRGLAWSLDRDKAAWFARRYAARRRTHVYLATAKLSKDKVLAHLLGRDEQEILCCHEHCQDVEISVINR